ncbi:hypothetical protein G5C60_12185 [Streptomyces sp. HC44]|uniref:Uncharacterized protein n=1 Tax=Streptomyces scabichelini TaxID=2711217 RepID=A0A6G4V3A1_9ACTN|nr:hypothetical protein [Streptomyces scabichelini]NGO08360.1 hypothetical protein [Streptomyces scabichelini]
MFEAGHGLAPHDGPSARYTADAYSPRRGPVHNWSWEPKSVLAPVDLSDVPADTSLPAGA